MFVSRSQLWMVYGSETRTVIKWKECGVRKVEEPWKERCTRKSVIRNFCNSVSQRAVIVLNRIKNRERTDGKEREVEGRTRKNLKNLTVILSEMVQVRTWKKRGPEKWRQIATKFLPAGRRKQGSRGARKAESVPEETLLEKWLQSI